MNRPCQCSYCNAVAPAPTLSAFIESRPPERRAGPLHENGPKLGDRRPCAYGQLDLSPAWTLHRQYTQSPNLVNRRFFETHM